MCSLKECTYEMERQFYSSTPVSLGLPQRLIFPKKGAHASINETTIYY